MERIRRALEDWMREVLDQRGWSAAEWARRAEVTPTNLTRFLRDPAKASLPSAETLGRLAWAAGSEPRFLGRPAAMAPVQRVPVLTLAQLRRTRSLGAAAAERFLEDLCRSGSATVVLDGPPRRAAFALRITSLHMNAGGLLPEDHVVLEPPRVLAPARGDIVVTASGENVCAYRHYPPLLVPVSTDSACCEPLPAEDAPVVGVAVQIVRNVRPYSAAAAAAVAAG